jgi:dTDP-4-dehydrorhamnose 3,5-epimerase
MRFKATPLAIRDVVLIAARPHADHRGSLTVTYEQSAFRALGLPDFVQDNQVVSARKGTVRGLHFQRPPYGQGKLVRVVRGAIFDVAVDVRAGSSTFGEWVAATLAATDANQLFIPRGFAHGYVTLADDTEVIYKCDAPYAPASEAGIHFADARLCIPWPVSRDAAILSERDGALPSFDEGLALGAPS